MKFKLAVAALALVVATPAFAAEYFIVQNAASKKCSVAAKKPTIGQSHPGRRRHRLQVEERGADCNEGSRRLQGQGLTPNCGTPIAGSPAERMGRARRSSPGAPGPSHIQRRRPLRPPRSGSATGNLERVANENGGGRARRAAGRCSVYQDTEPHDGPNNGGGHQAGFEEMFSLQLADIGPELLVETGEPGVRDLAPLGATGICRFVSPLADGLSHGSAPLQGNPLLETKVPEQAVPTARRPRPRPNQVPQKAFPARVRIRRAMLYWGQRRLADGLDTSPRGASAR